MSLLLEALRRAEEEAQKNKPTDTFAAATPAQHDAPAPSVVLTHRQAMSAAGVMAGSRPRTNAVAQPWRKGWLVLAVAMAFPVAALVLYGDVWVASVGMLATAPTVLTVPTVPIILATLPTSPPASSPELATPDSAPTTAVMAVLATTPVAEPLAVPAPPRPAAQRTPRTRLAAAAPSPEVADKAAADRDTISRSAAAATGPSLSLTASAAKPDAQMASAFSTSR
jgi:hypothetical protein